MSKHFTVRNISFIATVLLLIGAAACNSKPTVVNKVNDSGDEETTQTASNQSASTAEASHKVVVQSVLQAKRYTYLDVTENGKRFWIAVPKANVAEGGTYYYKGGLLKRNFKSEEYDRTFETIYLVSGLSDKPIFEGGSSVDEAFAKLDEAHAGHDHGTSDQNSQESVSLEDLFSNMASYDGKTIKVTGKCTKINKQIMGRNWVHLSDGTPSGSPHDLTVTTSADVPVGTEVTFTGKITLNKDFGAGYFYEILMEDAHTH